MRQFSESALRLTLAVSKAAPNSAFGKICILNVVMKDEVRFTQRSFPALSETSASGSCPESPLLSHIVGKRSFVHTMNKRQVTMMGDCILYVRNVVESGHPALQQNAADFLVSGASDH